MTRKYLSGKGFWNKGEKIKAGVKMKPDLEPNQGGKQ